MTRILVVCAVVTGAACSPPVQECINGDEPVCDLGMLPPDFCQTKEAAKGDPTNCSLTVTTGGAPVQRKQDVYISRLDDGGIDQDWYVVQMPAGLTARSLLHVNGGYQVPQTAVNFSLNVLNESTMTTVINGIDKHMAAAPKPVDLIVPFSESNAKLCVLVGDDASGAQSKVDNRNAYSLYMEVIENPDVNEPNDTTATVISLSGGMGSQSGYLATNDDLDLYTFDVTGLGRQIIYLHLGEDKVATPMHPTNPPPPFRLSYTLFDPMDVPIAEGTMANEFQEIDLSTARLAPMTGTYRVKVEGFKANGQLTPTRGDLRLKYTVNVQILPDLDITEPNDTVATAKVVTLGPNSSQTLVGKLAHVPDEEWFKVSLPARSSPSTLRYRVTAATTGGRFPPLSGTPARQLRVVRSVTTGATPSDRVNNCKTDRAVCPIADDATSSDTALINSICASNDPAFCLWAQRNEELPRLQNLRNLVGAVPVPPNTATEYYVMFRDEGLGQSKYADDRDWTLVLEWRDDPDEAMRQAGATMVSLNGSTVVSAGELTFGYGKYLDHSSNMMNLPDWFQPSNTKGIRGLNDYDAIDTDKDLFQFSYSGAMGDQGWELSWDVDHADGGTEPPGELSFEMTFCGGTGGNPMFCAGAERTQLLIFSEDVLTPWYLPMSAANGRMLFTKQNMATYTTYSATPVSCMCHSAARTAAGSYFFNVAGLHRISNDPIRYRISQRIFPYGSGGTFTVDGGTQSCPVMDGGCAFAEPP